MQKGYAGLPKKRTINYAGGPIARAGDDSARIVEHIDSTRPSGLHVVSVERRDPNRVQIPDRSEQLVSNHRLYDFSKRIFDIIVATLAILCLSPLIIGIILCARASCGSALFRHRRVGQGGKIFDCMKFRTMVPNADQVLQDLLDSNREIKEEWLRDHKLRDDPRVTRVGRFLRRTSLDELPQLWNVLRGEMSLVGPRPVVPDELRRYGTKVEVFLSARPGITGLWQVSGRNDMDYRRRVAIDVCYVRSKSLVLDVVILAKTLPAVIRASGAY